MPSEKQLVPFFETSQHQIKGIRALGQVPMLQKYYDRVVKNIWTGNLPEIIHVVDHTEPDGSRFASIDLVQMLLKAIAREILHQPQAPHLRLLRQESPRNSKDNPRMGPRLVRVVSKITVPNPIGHAANEPDFEIQLASDHFPRACVKFIYEDWDKNVQAEKDAMKANPHYQLCLAAIVSQLH